MIQVQADPILLQLLQQE